MPSRTTRVARAPSARQRASIPALLAITSRARPSAARTAAAPAGEPGAVWKTSPPWTETTSGAVSPARRTASPAGTALWAWTSSKGKRRRSARSATASEGAAQRPQLPYVCGRGGATNGT